MIERNGRLGLANMYPNPPNVQFGCSSVPSFIVDEKEITCSNAPEEANLLENLHPNSHGIAITPSLNVTLLIATESKLARAEAFT